MLTSPRRHAVHTLAAGALLFAAALQANAAEIAQPYGMAADSGAAQRDIRIDASTRYVNVQQGEIVRFVSEQGSFVWRFDTARTRLVFDLAHIVPELAPAQDIMVYVAESGDDR
ncbi:CzcE family metal-binding protein [Massilia sp. DD77]|uniref:CzcE family metal-binding protein n=1 Tax=Massilia sp. DD77 TaxID=3109349 RepID=UPI002FFFFAE4